MAALAIALVLVCGSAGARAGEYVVAECHVTHSLGAADAVFHTNTTVYPRSVSCPPGNGLTISNSGGIGGSYAYGAWQFTAPSGSHFSDIEFNYNRQGGSGHSSYIAVGDAAGGLLGIWNAGTGWQHANTDPMSNGHTLTSWLDCGGNCPHASSAHTFIKDLYFTIQDTTAPVIVGLGGTALAGGVRRGAETIEITGIDGQGGLSSASVNVNGVEVASPDAPCPGWGGPASGPARSFRPCVSNFAWTVVVNTEDGPWAEGENTVEVCIDDLSFDKAATQSDCETRTVLVDNSCPSSGGTQATSIHGGLQSGNGTPRSVVRIASDRSATARGILAGPGSVAGSTVCLYEQVDLPGDGRELVDTARVRSDGRFALNISPGPSRFFDVVYRYNNTVLEDEGLYLESVVSPAFQIVGRKSLLNGQNVRFRGLIPGPNAEGRGISLQARAGKKWRTFKQVRTDSRGVFRGLYRFTQTEGLAEYTFRARVKKQGDYPYSPGHSKRREVIVRG